MTESVTSFAELQLAPALLSALAEVGYETPSPIQAACIPALLAGEDILGEAQTGTGKTAAFALPVLQKIELKKAFPQALILTPTRELAIQVAEALQKYAHHMPGFHVLPLYGGQSMVVQLRQLSRGAHVIVGTPGRIMDHLERKSLVLDQLKMLVLDEADEMLRMGFIDDVEWILEHTPETRQTALFSATMPEQIRHIARSQMREPKEIKIKAATQTVSTIRQSYCMAQGPQKLEALTRILEIEEDFEAAIIFVRTKIATVELAEKLEARGYSVAALSGDLTQGLREQVIDRLKSGALDIVVATDVAARGIDVQRVSHVINYDVPYDTEAYVHRIGRTGRAGRAGRAILFISPREMRMLKTIERATRQKIEALAMPTMDEVADRRVAQFVQQIIDARNEQKLDFFFEMVRKLEEDHNLAAREIAAALAWLATRERPLQIEGKGQRETRDESAMSPRRSFDERPERAPREQREPRSDSFEKRRPAAPFAPSSNKLAKYRIEVGREHGVMPKEIVGAIANESGIEGRFIGQINLFDSYSTVELPADLPSDVMDILQRTRVKQQPLRTRQLAEGEYVEPPARRGPGGGGFGGKPGFGKDRPEASRRPYASDRPSASDRPRSPYADRPPRPEYAGRPERSERSERPAPRGDRPSFDRGGNDAPRRPPSFERPGGTADRNRPLTGERAGPGTLRADRPARPKPGGKKSFR